MKKIFAFILAVVMLAAAGLALAEDSDKAAVVSKGKLVVVEEVIMAAYLGIGGIGLLALGILVCSGKEVRQGQVGGNRLGRNSDHTLQPMTGLAALQIEVIIVRRGRGGIVIIIQTDRQPLVGVAQAEVHFAVLAVDGIAAHHVGIKAALLIAQLREENGGGILCLHLHATPDIFGLEVKAKVEV